MFGVDQPAVIGRYVAQMGGIGGGILSTDFPLGPPTGINEDQRRLLTVRHHST